MSWTTGVAESGAVAGVGPPGAGLLKEYAAGKALPIFAAACTPIVLNFYGPGHGKSCCDTFFAAISNVAWHQKRLFDAVPTLDELFTSIQGNLLSGVLTRLPDDFRTPQFARPHVRFLSMNARSRPLTRVSAPLHAHRCM